LNRGGNPAQIQRGTRTFARWRRQAAARVYGCLPRPRSALKEREARAFYAGFPPAREWRIFAVPVGSFSGGSGFSEFLRGLFRGNSGVEIFLWGESGARGYRIR
ncbi:MAG: hypothetical protein OXU61_10035, partial [Gammaproteobacteria bacterium]|nr:hypothetical protein [Gammaproteobacteria bacterium]